MAETITVTVPQLPGLVGSDADDLIAVWRGDGLGRVSRSLIRGTRVFSGPSNPPVEPSVIAKLNPALDDRWRNTLTGDEWKVTDLDPFTWTPDGSVRGPSGEATMPFTLATASEVLVTGNLVNLLGSSGVVRVRKADSGTPEGGRMTNGFVLTDAAVGETVPVYKMGKNTALTGLTPGADYYMGPLGSVVTPAPEGAGKTEQYVGTADTATILDVQPAPFVGLN